jgi:hypothetical protein
MASPDVEVIKLAGSCEPRGPTQQTFPDEQEETFPAQEPQQLTPAEKEESRAIKRRIGKYKALFSAETADLDLDPRSLDALVLDDLRDRARDTEYLVSTRRSAAAMRGMFLGALSTGEFVGPVVGLNLTGLATFASRSEELLLCVDECAIKYDTMVAVDPAVRLAMAVCQLALAVNEHNTREAAKTADVIAPLTPTS